MIAGGKIQASLGGAIALASLALASLALLAGGCGSTAATSTSAGTSGGSGTAGGDAADVRHTSGAAAPGSGGGGTRIPNVCGLLTTQQIDAALGSGYSSGQVGRPQPGYMGSKSAPVAIFGPNLVLKSAALCNWENLTVTESGLHPQFGYGIDTLSAPVSAAFFFAKHSEAQSVSGLGQWAGYDPLSIDLTVGLGDQVLILDTSVADFHHPPDLRVPLTNLARIILSKLE